jgi:hypothetical protein
VILSIIFFPKKHSGGNISMNILEKNIQTKTNSNLTEKIKNMFATFVKNKKFKFEPFDYLSNKVYFDKCIEELKKDYPTITLEQLRIIHRMELQHVAESVDRKQYEHEIEKSLLKDESLLAISDRLFIPPALVLKMTLSKFGLNHDEIKAAMEDSIKLGEALHYKRLYIDDKNKKTRKKKKQNIIAKLKYEFDNVLDKDVTSFVYGFNDRSKDDAFETLIAKTLRKLGISFLTEKELRQSKSPITPDYLLRKPITLHNSGKNYQIFWIDAKNYPHYDSLLTREKLVKQAAKYVDAFGPGAFIFNGILGGPLIKDTVNIDGSAL